MAGLKICRAHPGKLSDGPVCRVNAPTGASSLNYSIPLPLLPLQYGEEGVKEMGQGGGPGGGMSDIFEMFTGGGRRGGAPRERRGENVVHR